MESDDRAQWSKFWQQGFITTFGASKPDNYDGVVREFWLAEFSGLPVGAHILDIATGNGAIATLAAEFSSTFGKDFSIAATDLAEISETLVIDPAGSRLRGNIDFHSHTPCEKQPFKESGFDFVSSQFGFEYSNTGQTLKEVRRVLVPGGKFSAISHHEDSNLIKAALLELEVYQSALDELGLFRLLRKYLVAADNMGGSTQKLAKAKKQARPFSLRINAAMDQFRQRYNDQQCAKEIVGAFVHLARNARNTEKTKLLSDIRAAEEEFRFARERLRDMVGASLGDEQIEALAHQARSEGFTSVKTRLLHGEGGDLAGWQIQIQ